MMTGIASIMVPVDGEHPTDAQLDAVGALAADLGARIVGVSASDHLPSFYFAAGAVASDILEEDEKRMREAMAVAEKRCRAKWACRALTVDWHSAIDLPIDVVLRQSRIADLIVCFCRGESTPYSFVEPGELVLKAGRPIVVVPPGAGWRAPHRLLVAWKDSRESRRAVLDALPLLRRAQDVTVVEIIEGEESPRQAEARVDDIVGWLKLHGIRATRQVVEPRRDSAAALAEAADAADADWIVAGAYGHTRLGEWIFGGITRYLLTDSTRPAFLSH